MKTTVMLTVLFAAACCGAVTRTVPAEYPTIQSAIYACLPLDVVLVGEGVYHENINFGGRAITVTSLFQEDGNHAHIANTVIEGTGTASAVTFSTNEGNSSVLKGFTVRGGNSAVGGGIRVLNASPSLERLVIYGNTGSYCAGLLLNNSSAVVTSLTISGNTGRGFRCIGSGTPQISSCIVFGNTEASIISTAGEISFSDLESETGGNGNIFSDPLFIDPGQNDYHLQEISPCLNTGSPFLNPDPDGTRADMGAFFTPNTASSLFADFSALETTSFSNTHSFVQFTSMIYLFNCNVSLIEWDFGDGESSNFANPTHGYDPGGRYTVTMQVTAGEHQQTVVKPDYIVVYHLLDSGSIGGTMSADGSPYYISVDSEIQNLDVGEGTEIYVADGVWLDAIGTVQISGTLGQPVIIEPLLPTDQGGELIFNGNTGLDYCRISRMSTITLSGIGAVLANCRISDSDNIGIIVDARDVSITGTEVQGGNEIAVQVNRSDATLENCNIHDNRSSSITVSNPAGAILTNISISNCTLANSSQYMSVVNLTNVTNTVISDNDISSGFYGIRTDGSCNVIIDGNVISGNEQHGISLGFGTRAQISGNVINNNNMGIVVINCSDTGVCIEGNLIRHNYYGGIILASSSALIYNNTIVDNCVYQPGRPVILTDDLSTVMLVNNIIYNNPGDIGTDTGAALSIGLAYNILQYPMPDDSIDYGGNLITDPLFWDTESYGLSTASPAIDSGNPDTQYYNLLPHDIWGGTRVYDGNGDGTAVVDRGCNEYEPTAVNDETIPGPAEIQIRIHPNPARGLLWVECLPRDDSALYAVEVFNLRGQKVRTLSAQGLRGNVSLKWDGRDSLGNPTAEGVYILRVGGGSGWQTKKFIFMN
jgi:parallel beta-helix repeat protein